MLAFNTTGVAAPQFNTSSPGTKILLYPNVTSTSADFAIGISNATLWNSIPNASTQFQWYAGTSVVATLSGGGALNVAQGINSSNVGGLGVSAGGIISAAGNQLDLISMAGAVLVNYGGGTSGGLTIYNGATSATGQLSCGLINCGTVNAAGGTVTAANGFISQVSLLLSYSGAPAGTGFYHDASNAAIRTAGSVYFQGANGSGIASIASVASITAVGTVTVGPGTPAQAGDIGIARPASGFPAPPASDRSAGTRFHYDMAHNAGSRTRFGEVGRMKPHWDCGSCPSASIAPVSFRTPELSKKGVIFPSYT
jgi:hypothetical protein